MPIGVVGRDGNAHVVNWIDSKAMFGDNHTHFTHNGAQLRGYVNRFGPGMVVYWAGVVDTIGQVAEPPSASPGAAANSSHRDGRPRPSSGGEGRHGRRHGGGGRGRSRGRDGGSDSDGRSRRGGGFGGGGAGQGGKPPTANQGSQSRSLWTAGGGESTAEDVVVVAALPRQFVMPGEGEVRADPVFRLPPGALSATF